MQKRPSLLVLSAIGRFFMVALALLALTGNASAASAGRIYCQGTELMADGSRIYLNGANTPWNSWNEFGGTYDSAWWSAEFARMKAKGINSTRIWFSCDGTVQPTIDGSGVVTSVTAQFWSNVDDLMAIAQANQIYVMATMMSFDHCDVAKANHLRWRAMFGSTTKVDAMINNYLLPFVLRYKDSPYLYAIDLCNEIEAINDPDSVDPTKYGAIPLSQLQRYVARSAAAIHDSGSTVLVTVGSTSVKWTSPKYYDGNWWSNSALQLQYANSKAFLDFYQVHYYYWMEPWFPLLQSATQLQLNDRPLVMGEMPGKPTNGSALLWPAGQTMASLSEFFFANGFSGHYPWSSNGIDINGSLTDFGAAALAFLQAHPTVIRFPSTGTAQTITFPVIATQSWSGSNLTVSLSATASSGLAVAYTVTSGPATVSASTLTITGSGSVVIAANQGGNSTYSAASQVLQTVAVADGHGSSASSNSSSSSSSCGMGGMLAMLALMMFGLFQRSQVTERLRGRSR